MFALGFCRSDEAIATSPTVPSGQTGSTSSTNSPTGAMSPSLGRGSDLPEAYSSGPRLSIIPTLPSNEPLELLALANEAVCDRDALLACKRIAELTKDFSTSWMREQVAQCLARAYLLLGDIFPFSSRFPPTDALFASIPNDEPCIVAIICKDNRQSELVGVDDDDELDGLASFPVTFYRSQPAIPFSRDFHAEAVMLCDAEEGETIHLVDPRIPAPGTSLAQSNIGANRRGNKAYKTYYARRLYEGVFAVICFSKSVREANDPVVQRFLDRLERLFIL